LRKNPSVRRRAERAFPVIAIVVIAVLLVVDQSRFTFAYMRHWVNEDHTLLWYAARDLGHGHVYQSSFYGESYFTVFDAIPAEVLRRLGMTLATATVVSGAFLAVIGWPMLAVAAWRRGHRALATAALALPLVLTFEFLVASEKPSGGGMGMLFSMGAVALLVASPTRRANVVAFALLGALGAVFDFGNVYLVAPAAVYALIVNWHALRTLIASAIATVPALGWLLYQRAFFHDHPDYNLHIGAGYTPKLSNLAHSLPHPGRYFGWQAPELARWVGVPIAAAGVLLVLLFATRRLRAILPAVAVITLVVATLAMPRAFDGTPSAFLGYGRYFVALPVAAWFLAFILAETRPFARPSAALTNRLIVAVLGVAVVAAAGHALLFNSRLRSITRVAERPDAGAILEPVSVVDTSCARVTDVVRRQHVDLALYHVDRASAYGCGALQYGRFTALYPKYDRRTWLLHREAHTLRTVFLAVDVDAGWCAHARSVPGVLGCTMDAVTPSVAVVHTKPNSALTIWRRLGEDIRTFDDRAH